LEVALRVPETMEAMVTAGDHPIKGIFVTLRFAMSRKNPFDLVFGPSGDRGEITITRAQVLEESRKSMELFIMDYADLETHWTGRLRATPMNREAVGHALAAYKLFRRFEYPPGYEHDLHAADAALEKISDAKLKAVVRCETADPIEVESLTV
jgi:hypothetical protein